MLTDADWEICLEVVDERLYADVCGRMLTYADVCGRMRTYADVC
jgi:hypothetical protein